MAIKQTEKTFNATQPYMTKYIIFYAFAWFLCFRNKTIRESSLTVLKLAQQSKSSNHNLRGLQKC